MTATIALVLALIFLPLAFLLGGALVKFGAYLAGVKMPGLFKASLLGFLATCVSGWVTPLVLTYAPTGDHIIPVLITSMVASVLVGGFVFKLTMGLSYCKGLVVSLAHRSIGLASATVGIVAYLVLA